MIISIKLLINKFIHFDSQQYQMPKLFLHVLQIQYCLINISYIELNAALIDKFPQVRMVQLIGRPQLIIQIEGIEYFTFLISFLYWLAIFTRFTGWQHFALYASLLDMSLLNFLIEQTITIIQLVCIASLIMITLTRTFISRSKYDISVKNTDYIENNILLILFRLTTLAQIGINYLSQQATQVIAIFNCSLFGMIILKYRILGPYKITEIGFCIQMASLYYSVLIVLEFSDSFTTDIIFLPFIYKIGSNLIFKMDQDDLRSQKITQQLLNYSRESRSSLYGYQIENNKKNISSLNIKTLTTRQQTILASALIYESPLKALKLLFVVQNKHEQDLLFQSMINLLIQKSFKSLKQMIESKIKCPLQSHKFIDVMRREQLQHDIYMEISFILRLKMNLMITYSQEIRNLKYYNDSISVVGQIIMLKQKIADYYKLYPSLRNKAVYIFYLIEVLNDIISASEVGGFASASTTDFNRSLNIKDGLNSCYMITEYRQDVIIKSVSKKLADQINQSTLQLVGQNIAQFIPIGIREHHNNMIDKFLISGESKFYQTTDTIMVQQADSGVLTFEFSFDISFTNASIQFIALFQETFEQPYYLIADSQGLISAESHSLQQYLQATKICRSLIGLNIKDVIFNIDQLQNNVTQLEEAVIQIGNVRILTQLQIQDRIIDNLIIYSIIRLLYMKRVLNYPLVEEIDQSMLILQFNSQFNEDTLVDIPKEILYLQESDQNPFKTIEVANQIESNRISQDEMMLMGQRKKKDIYYDTSRALQDDSHQSLSLDKLIESQSYKKINHEERSSMVSSYQTMKSSVFYKKYQIVQKINNLSGQSKAHNLHFSFLALCVISSLVLGIVQLVNLKDSLSSLVQDIDLLQIKNIATQPLESFQITRYTLLNYNSLLTSGRINESYYTQLVVYPRSNLVDGFNLLNSNLKTVMDRQELQEELMKVHQYSIYVQALGRNVSTINMTLRNFLDTLLQYQQTAMKSYLSDGLVVPDSPYLMFQFNNHPKMKTTFQKINSQIYTQTLQTASTVERFADIILGIILNISCMLMIIAIYHRQTIVANCDKYYETYYQFYDQDVKNELKRLKSLMEFIARDENIIFSYNLKIGSLEKSINRKDHNSEMKKAITKTRFTKLTLLPFILISAALISDVITTYVQSKYFLQRYPATVELYWQMSDIGTDIPTMYAEREALYQRVTYPFLNNTNIDDLYIEVMSALRRTQLFLSKQYSNNLVISSSFIIKLNIYNQQSLCPYIPINNGFNNTLDLCQQVLEGNLQNGLKQLLTYITNQIQTDQELNNFTVKTYYNFLELEGIYMTSLFIRVLNDAFRTDLLAQTSTLITQIQAYNIIYFISLILLLILGLKFYTQILIRHYHNCQRLIFLIPRNTIFLDDQFERNINMRIINDLLN